MADKFDGSIKITINPEDDFEKLHPLEQKYAFKYYFRYVIPALIDSVRHLGEELISLHDGLLLTSPLDKYLPRYGEKTKADYRIIANVYKTLCDKNKEAYKNGDSDDLPNVNAENLRDRLNLLISEGKLKIKPRVYLVGLSYALPFSPF